MATPQVPPGWRAEWSGEHGAWYYLNLTTQASQWDFPAPIQQYGAPSPQQSLLLQQPIHTAVPQQQALSPQPSADGPPEQDGERGLGKIAAGGLIGVAGGLIAGAIFNNDKDKIKKQHTHFGIFNHEDSSDSSDDDKHGSGGGWFSKLGGGTPDFVKPAAVAAVGGGFMGKMASHMPNMTGSHANTYPNSAPVPQYQSPQYQAPQYQAPQHQAPQYQAQATHLPQQVPNYNKGNAPPLHIICAAYADQDVTQIVRRMVLPTQSIDFNTNELAKVFGDPWPTNDRKQFSVIYAYGPRPWEVLATSDSRGTLSLIPHQPLDKTRMEYVQPPPSRVVAIIWGMCNGLDGGDGREKKVKQIEETGEFQATNGWIGFDGMCGPPKTAICYYRAGNGEVRIAAAREGGTCRLPWNPLARWS